MEAVFVVIGGGIAGVSCIEALNQIVPEATKIILTESSLIKTVTNLSNLSRTLFSFQVKEESLNEHHFGSNVEVVVDKVSSIETHTKSIYTVNNICVKYEYLCICTGAKPKLIKESISNDLVLGIRDTESVMEFEKRLKNGKRLVIVGNGGIASEIAHEIKSIAIDWIVKDGHITSTFIDSGAAHFFTESIKSGKQPERATTTVKRMRYLEEATRADHNNLNSSKSGAALGPDWHRLLDLKSIEPDAKSTLNIHYNCEVKSLDKVNDKLNVELTNGEKIVCDFLVSATGVDCRCDFKIDCPFNVGPDGGIYVNEFMETSIENIFAAGDVCYAGWNHSTHWFQMRLWTQARQMGLMAGKSMASRKCGLETEQDFCFEIFGHVTQLFGYQVVLLGKFNGQGLDNKYEILLRTTPNMEYIKLILVDGRLQGALLIGDTGLEETCENLIANQLDLTPFGDEILDPNIDIEDYFD